MLNKQSIINNNINIYYLFNFILLDNYYKIKISDH